MKISILRLWFDPLIATLLVLLPLSLLHPEQMITNTTATGGDMASQVLGARLFVDEILPQGRLSAWVPEVFGGFPFLSYYFPLPFLVIALFSAFLPFGIAFKWATMLGVLLLPGAAYFVGRLLRFDHVASFCGALGSLCFLLHEQNSIWGGNLLSTLAGEFSYSYGMVLAILTMAVWSRGIATGRHWILGGCLEALVGLSHGYALLVVGFSTLYFFFQPGRFKRNFIYLCRTHSLAFFLLGFWLWPLLELGPYITPNDTAHIINNWRELLPTTLRPVLLLGLLAALCAGVIPFFRRNWSKGRVDHALYFTFTAGIALIGWFSAELIGLSSIRFFPFVWLMTAMVGGWAIGALFTVLPSVLTRGLAVAGLFFITLGLLGSEVSKVSYWTLWNHSGLESKAMWPTLKSIFPVIRGDLSTPRLIFEHDPANNDIGSTRVLETLPMFIGGRPVLEGLYMESAPLGPVIYQLQSEISARPSSPLSQYPSGSLDPVRAALHLKVLNTQDLLLRSPMAKNALAATGLYEEISEIPPFTIYRLKDFTSHYVQPVNSEISVSERRDWKDKSFAWFLKLKQWNDPPVAYLTPAQWQAKEGRGWPTPEISASQRNIKKLEIERHRIRFETMAPGIPHLIRFGYNPRWRSRNGEPVYLISPGFMMVVPESSPVELYYGSTTVMIWGRCGSVLALMIVVVFGLIMPLLLRKPLLVGFFGESLVESTVSTGQWLTRLGGFILIAGSCWILFLSSAKQVYQEGHQYFASQEYEKAAGSFDQAFAGRKVMAQKEEALFWAARALELAGDESGAIRRYRRLTEEYHAYWVPESLFRLATLFAKQGQNEDFQGVQVRLRDEFPQNKWTLNARQIHVR